MSSPQAPLVGRNCWRKASAMFRVRQTPHAWLVYFGPGASTNRMMCDAWVVRGNEKSTLLIAARKDVATNLTMLDHEVTNDHPYTEKKVEKIARSRVLVCQVLFKQNIGHIGNEIVVAGVHGHNRTMKLQWPDVFTKFWDGLAKKDPQVQS